MNNKDVQLKNYLKKMAYSYSMGAFPTIELLHNWPDKVIKILIHENMDSQIQLELMKTISQRNKIKIEWNSKAVEKLRDKENCFVIGVFEKFTTELEWTKNHIVLVNPSDMGNIGTIMRSCVGFGINNLAVIEPAVDIFHPKAVRASMGAVFQLNIQYFSSFIEYKQQAGHREWYPFMLKGAKPLQELERDKQELFSLIFGNEATGLCDDFSQIGQSVVIRHTDQIDSLNLSLAVGIGLYEFTK